MSLLTTAKVQLYVHREQAAQNKRIDKTKAKKAQDEHLAHFKEMAVLYAAFQRNRATADQAKSAMSVAFGTDTTAITKVTNDLLHGKIDVDDAITNLRHAPQKSYIIQKLYQRLIGAVVPDDTDCTSYSRGVFDQSTVDAIATGYDPVACGYIADAAFCRCTGTIYNAESGSVSNPSW